MRFLFKISLPVEAGNEAAKKDGFKAIQSILEQQKPEAAYFAAQDGKRTAFLVMDMKDASDIPGNVGALVPGTQRSDRSDTGDGSRGPSESGSCHCEAVKAYG